MLKAVEPGCLAIITHVRNVGGRHMIGKKVRVIRQLKPDEYCPETKSHISIFGNGNTWLVYGAGLSIERLQGGRSKSAYAVLGEKRLLRIDDVDMAILDSADAEIIELMSWQSF